MLSSADDCIRAPTRSTRHPLMPSAPRKGFKRDEAGPAAREAYLAQQPKPKVAQRRTIATTSAVHAPTRPAQARVSFVAASMAWATLRRFLASGVRVTRPLSHHHESGSTLIYNVMVPTDIFQTFELTRAAYFPAYRVPPEGASILGMGFLNPIYRDRDLPRDHPLFQFDIVTYQHDSFDSEWPIQVDVPTALKGFRHSLGLSQVKFAEATGQTRLNIERWEGGKARPFRGHVHALLSLLRPLVKGPLAAGQLLNLAAEAVCPKLTRPAATYSGHEIEAHLVDGHDDHRDLAPALIYALVNSRILISLDDDSVGELDAAYIAAVGVRTMDRDVEPWEAEMNALARRMDTSDRKLWLALGQRLAGSANKGDIA